MKPSETQQYLAIYADGELPEHLRGEIEDQLRRDPASRAEVQRWQALRRSAHRALRSDPLPSALRERVLKVTAAARRRRPRQAWRIVSMVIAAAAIIGLALLVRRPASPGDRHAPIVSPEGFARVHLRCAVERQHDALGLAGKTTEMARAVLAEKMPMDSGTPMPDFSSQGYLLAGVCACPPAEGLRSIHAAYERTGAEPASAAHGNDMVSFFCVGCRVQLPADADAGHETGTGHPQRQYEVARTIDNINVLKWDEGAHSFAMCSRLPPDELLKLTDATDFAALSSFSAPAVASAEPRLAPLAAIGLIALAVVGIAFACRSEGP